MKLINLIARFRKDEDGAVTVDWVVLTAGIVVVAVAMANLFGTELGRLAEGIQTTLTGYDPFEEE